MGRWIRQVAVPGGRARLVADRPSGPTRANLVLGHGASGNIDAIDLATLAAELPRRHDIAVIRIEQPYVLAGRRRPPPAHTLAAAWTGALDQLRIRRPLFVGGRSLGARVACWSARAQAATGCVCLAFPLHPPGAPERSRAAELLAAGVPTLVVQGDRDRFGGPAELPAGPRLVPVAGADHGFAVARSAGWSQDDALDHIVEAVAEFVTGLL